MTLLAARPVDFAIFFTMGGLWLFGAVFIVLVWRWFLRFERREGSSFDPPVEQRRPVPPPRAKKKRASDHAQPSGVAHPV